MPSLRVLVIAGVAALLIGLLVAFPARLAWQWIAPPGIALQDISGTVWRGGAREANAGGVYLTDVRWRFHPLSLLGGRIEYRVGAQPVSGSLEADLSIAAGGAIRLQAVTASLPIAALGAFIEVTGLSGDVSLQVEQLVIDDGLPVDVAGRVGLANLVISPLAPTPLGDFEGTLETVDGVIRGEVADVSGVLDLRGSLELRPDRTYLFTGLIATRPGAPAAIEEQLQYLGSADAEGRHRFGFEGQL